MKKQKKNRQINLIGLDEKLCGELAEKLNILLADYSIFYQNVRGFHWNIKGEKFFELHVKFEELYTDLQVKIDEIAERILTLGHTPYHNYSDYISMAALDETDKISGGEEAVENILHSFSEILVLQREILDLTEEANDEGTNALMSDYISQQEKLVWMYAAYAKK